VLLVGKTVGPLDERSLGSLDPDDARERLRGGYRVEL